MNDLNNTAPNNQILGFIIILYICFFLSKVNIKEQMMGPVPLSIQTIIF